MGNLSVGMKKFLSNKNTVTVIGVIAAVLVLYIGYNWRVRLATNPVTVPFAKVTISPGVQITEDMIGTMEVPPAMLKGNPLRSVAQVVDKYSAADSVIPEGSLFYSRSVVEKGQLPASIILDYPKGYELYNLPVTIASTYGNSIFPGNYIDIYLKASTKTADGADLLNDQSNRVMLGKLIENVRVLAVKDSSGQAVFGNQDENRQPAMIIFAVPQEYFVLLKKASFLRTYESELIPVPTANSLEDEPGDIKVSNDQMKDFINRVTVWTEGME